jgi:hypothetical protein
MLQLTVTVWNHVEVVKEMPTFRGVVVREVVVSRRRRAKGFSDPPAVEGFRPRIVNKILVNHW